MYNYYKLNNINCAHIRKSLPNLARYMNTHIGYWLTIELILYIFNFDPKVYMVG